MLLARPGSRSVEPRARLDVEMRRRPERLAQNRPGISMSLRFIALSLLLTLAPAFSAEEKLTGGNGTLYLGGRPNRIFIIDEATEKVVGEIKTKTGSPAGMDLSEDKKRFYVGNMSFEDIEIVDIASRQVIDNFRLSEGNKKARIFGFAADP